MRKMITSVVVSVLLGGFTGAAAQLPPEIMVDRSGTMAPAVSSL